MMSFSLKAKAIFFTLLTVALSILGVGIAMEMLRTEHFAISGHHFYGIPTAWFALLLTLLLAILVVALIWVDYRLHRKEAKIHLELEEQVSRRTEQLMQANEQLMEMDRLKSELIHRVSHELRTPLTSISGYSEILLGSKAGSLNELQEDFIRTIAENAIRLQSMVSDILETSRWESGSQHVMWQEVSLEEIARQAVNAMRPMIEVRNLDFRQLTMPDLPPVMGDPAKLLQLFNNLLSNAIKYTSTKGQVTFQIESKPGRIIIEVEDTGVGIPKEFHPRLFQKFERAANVESPEYSGAGLGLYLVKQIVDAHRGTIHLESELGKGTRATVSLPVQDLKSAELTTSLKMISTAERRNE